MIKFSNLKRYLENKQGSLCEDSRDIINEIVVYLESQIKQGKLNEGYESNREDWQDNGEYNPDEEGRYLIRLDSGHEYEVIWEGNYFHIEGHPLVPVDDQKIMKWKIIQGGEKV